MLDNSQKQFLNGSQSHKSYLMFAVRGDVALGIRPLGIVDGAGMGASGKSYLHARVRSCRAPKDFLAQYGLDENGSVVKLADQKLGFDEAWPEIEFDKADDERASAIVGVFLRGSLSHDPEVVLKRLEEEDFLLKLAEYVCDRAGYEHLVMRPLAVAGWLHEKLDPEIGKFKAKLKAHAEFGQHAEEHVEVFGFQTSLLNKLYKKHAGDGDTDSDTGAAG